ncbi:MAG: hypothetical protein IJO54_04215 [Oscillospiraceae bacterium]|nr:hypothetical protein [Oscillospiraceae bacterium]
MAEKQIKKNTTKKSRKNLSTIDPIYRKFSKNVVRTLMSTDFYEYFMDAIASSKRQMQFSNKKVEKIIDLRWIEALEASLDPFQNIITNPRNIIREEEIIVNVAHAKKGGSDVVRHLAQHSSYVEDFNYETGDVRPSKLMQKIRDDSSVLYENRIVYTTLEAAYHFVTIRYDALMANMSEEMGAKLKMETDIQFAKENVHFDMFMHIKENDDPLTTDAKNRETFERIARIQRLLAYYMSMPAAQMWSREQRVRGVINKTNVLKKHPDYKKIVALYEFLRLYDEVGYVIKIKEQNPEINETFENDIYHNLMFNYIILKGYLEDEEDREIPVKGKNRKRTLKPKFIHQIIEEIVEDYNLPDVEVRKILIEELTKEQLKYEEEQERQHIIEETERARKKAEEELMLEKARKKAEAKRQREAELKRRREEKEAFETKKKQEKLLQMAEDRRRTKPILDEYENFMSNLLEKTVLRRQIQEEIDKRQPQQDYEDFVRLIEEEEQRKFEEQERLARERYEAKQRKAEEKRLQLQQQRLEEKRRQMEADALVVAPIREELAAFMQFCKLQIEKRGYGVPAEDQSEGDNSPQQ